MLHTHARIRRSRPLHSWRGAALLALLALAAAAFAQAPLEVSLERAHVVEVVVDGEATEEFRTAVELAPGEVIQETLVVRNASAEALREIALVLPVPAGTRYLGGSAGALDFAGGAVLAEFSYDGGATFGLPPLLREEVVVKDGHEVIVHVPVSPDEYTHARWVLPRLEAQAAITSTLRAVVR